MKMKVFLLCVGLFALVCAAAAQSLIVNTKYGPVRGISNDMAFNFLGIPYAQPPIGELRWADPQPHAAWTSVLDVTEFAPGLAVSLVSYLTLTNV